MVLLDREHNVLFIEILTAKRMLKTGWCCHLLNNLLGLTIIQSPRNTMAKAVSHVPA